MKRRSLGTKDTANVVAELIWLGRESYAFYMSSTLLIRGTNSCSSKIKGLRESTCRECDCYLATSKAP